MALFRTAIDKLRQGLTRTREGSARTFTTLLRGQPLSLDLLRELEKALIQADVGVRTAVEIRKDIEAAWDRGELDTGDQALTFLKQQLVAYFPEEDRTLHLGSPRRDAVGLDDEKRPSVILVVGVNGSGKTTSIAKICKSLRDEGRTVLLGAADTFRAAAVEQLEIWSHRIGVNVIKGKQGGDPAAVAFDAAEAAIARQIDVLVIDTAGRLQTQEPLMRQLAKIRSVLAKKIEGAPHETLLVIDATTGQNGIQQAKTFAAATEVTGIFLTKLDGTARGGIVIAIREELNLPVKLIGTGETLDDIQPFEPEKFVGAMFGESGR